MNSLSPAAAINALILDIDGTLFWGNTPISGLRALFEFLQTAEIPFVIASNNATKSPTDYQHKLAAHGVDIDVAAILTAGIATAAWLQGEFVPGAALYVIGEAALHQALFAHGFVLKLDAEESVDAVVVGGDATLTYKKLKHAALLLQRGARFVGTNPDVVYPTEEGMIPEAGTTLAALEAATGVNATVIGKPERHLFDMAIEHLGSRPAETAIVGDRLETDILGGQRAGLKTILTTTGVDNEKSIVKMGVEPDWVIHGLNALVEFLRGEHGWTHAD